LGKREIWLSWLGFLFFGLNACQEPVPQSVPLLTNTIASPEVSSVQTHLFNPPYTIAILPLDNVSPNPRLHWLGKSFSEMLANDLAKWPSLSVISREALGPVLREQWLQQRGYSSSVAPVDLGKIQGVRYLVRGAFHQFEDHLRIDLQIVDVETGVVVRSLNAQGLESDLPRIEQDLVKQMFVLFDSTQLYPMGAALDVLEETSLPTVSGERGEGGASVQPEHSQMFGEQAVHPTDIQLSLERITQHRMQAYQVADGFWKAGWSAEIGVPMYHVWQSSQEFSLPVTLLTLPVSFFFEPQRIAEVLTRSGKGSLPSFIQLERDGFTRGPTDDTGASHIFFEHVRQPRRLFVRAMNEHGELMAVFSKWSWQTEMLFDMPNVDRILFPMWPQPFMSGLAEFPVAWVERGGAHVTFDAVMVPIPDEQRTIILEPIVLSHSEEQEDLLATSENLGFLVPLKNLIHMKWHPPITEALPVNGYLPANSRTAVALVHLEGGRIATVQWQAVPQDDLFSRSLEELTVSLAGFCVKCSDSATSSSGSVIQAIRLQLNVERDLHGLQFGSKSD